MSEALITRRGGGANPIEDWYNNNSFVVAPSSTTTMTLRANISNTDGGWFTGFGTTSATTTYIAVEVDGVFKLGSATKGYVITSNITMPTLFRYESTLKVYSNSTDSMAFTYTKGKDFATAELFYYAPTPTGTISVTPVNKSSSGRVNMIGGNSSSSSARGILTLDGVVVFDGWLLTSIFINRRFETSIKFEASTTAAVISWVED